MPENIRKMSNNKKLRKDEIIICRRPIKISERLALSLCAEDKDYFIAKDKVDEWNKIRLLIK